MVHRHRGHLRQEREARDGRARDGRPVEPDHRLQREDHLPLRVHLELHVAAAPVCH